MYIVKFIVLFECISVLSALQTDYCNICINHTMCQFTVPGPSSACKLYDSTALLTSKERQELINKINERRNFIAMGHSMIFPQAANMKKIHWSSELALSAQRWADQCDPFQHPDREDICRNLENTDVGQNIASVSGTTTGLSVKSFVEMWFMEILDYSGSVTYYNQSQDESTKHLTQLIWAETEYVGCGKVKFYISERNMKIIRLVCNFAPKGNIKGKPIYAIGHSSTQCPNKMVPDKDYQGLCDYENIETIKQSTAGYSVSSLLRILNLSNDNVKQEIDPIRNNFRARNRKNNKHKNQVARYVTSNNSHGAARRIPLRILNMRMNLQNITRNMRNDPIRQHKLGHSHVYRRTEEPHLEPPYTTTRYFHGNMMPGLQPYDYTPPPLYRISSAKYGNHNSNHRCTRSKSPNCCNTHRCTRGQHHCCQQVTLCQAETVTNPMLLNTICPQISMCSSTCPTIGPVIYAPSCSATHDCECSKYIQLSAVCQNIPNMIRSGEHNFSTPPQKTEHDYDLEISDAHKIKHGLHNTDQLRKHLNYEINDQDRDNFYRSIEPSYREKRENEFSIRPFWQLKVMNLENTPELKSLKYTTLPHRNRINTRRNMQAIFKHISTKSITMLKEENSNYENNEEMAYQDKTTGKYLSFDELMNLRRLTDNYIGLYPRRKAGPTTKKPTPETTKTAPPKTTKTALPKNTPKAQTKTTKAALRKKPEVTTTATNKTTTKETTKGTTKATKSKSTTPEYTVNTQFERKKHCTRKLTCTWTAPMSIAENGNKVGFVLDMGSRTPPGYVEGCSRTSTCTRDFMNRNKMATASDDNEAHNVTVAEDEEYCEKRSLKVYKRDSDYIVPPIAFHKDIVNSCNASITNHSGCVCNKKIRMKRQKILSSKDVSKVISYADLYYLILNKVMKSSDAESCNINRCGCNQSNTYKKKSFCSISFVILFILESLLIGC